MRHGQRGRKFNRTKSQRNALLVNLATSLVQHEQIKTTLPKAKDLRPFVERLVTAARQNTLHQRRLLLAQFQHHAAPVEKLLQVLGPRFQQRPGGYTRIVKAGFRAGDRAPMAVIEFVDREVALQAASSTGV